MAKYTYKTVKTKGGNVHRFRCWTENFKDEDTGQLIPIDRHRLIKVNGKKVVWMPGATSKSKGAIPRKELI